MIYLQFLTLALVGMLAFWFGQNWLIYPTPQDPSWYVELTIPAEDMPELCITYGWCPHDH